MPAGSLGGAAAEYLAELATVLQHVDQQLAPLHPSPSACGSCGRCCVGPPIYMSLSDLEMAWIRDGYPDLVLRRRVVFEPLGEHRPDRRHAYRWWQCPFYERERGCTVYARRPLACRVYGPMAPAPIEWEQCSYQATAQIYTQPTSIPGFSAWQSLMQRAGARRGYLYYEQMRYVLPTVELLYGHESKDGWLARARIPLPPLENACYSSAKPGEGHPFASCQPTP